MKILIVTQKVDKDDDVLGFFHDWITEFSKQYERVTVVCLEMGEYELLKNVEVFSLGKERKKFRLFKKIIFLFKYYKLIWQLRKDYDLVFVHMVPMYAILGAPVWKLLKKKIALWYTHGHVPLALRVSEKLVDVIFTATKESCRLESERLKIVGHGIDTLKFSHFASRDVPRHVSTRDKQYGAEKLNFNIISVGRIAPIKDYETLIRALDIVVKNYKIRKVRLKIVGAALLDEHAHYFRKLKKLVHELGLAKYIEFTGSVSFTKIKEHLETADLMASTSRTGSLDKVMLEAISMELPVITCNEAMREVLLKNEKRLMYTPGDYKKLAQLITDVINMSDLDRGRLGEALRKVVVKNHGLENLIKKIKKLF